MLFVVFQTPPDTEAIPFNDANAPLKRAGRISWAKEYRNGCAVKSLFRYKVGIPGRGLAPLLVKA
jgi:hypothetical protein